MNIDTIRAWKDRSYRASLSAEEQALLPENPVGLIELTDDELKAVSGGQAQTGPGVSSVSAMGCTSGNCSSVGGGNICQSQGGQCLSQQGFCQSAQAGGGCKSAAGQNCATTVTGTTGPGNVQC